MTSFDLSKEAIMKNDLGLFSDGQPLGNFKCCLLWFVKKCSNQMWVHYRTHKTWVSKTSSDGMSAKALINGKVNLKSQPSPTLLNGFVVLAGV